MKDIIKKMESNLNELKIAYAEEERNKYENKEHKHFEIGSIVSNGYFIGVVKWSHNTAIDCPYQKGMMGVDILNGERGFGCFKRDEFNLVEDDYYLSKYSLKVELTGIEIEDIKYSLRRTNPSQTTAKLLCILDNFHKGKK